MNAAPSSAPPPLRILVVDDDDDSRLALALLLETNILTVSEATSLTSARTKLRSEQYDLVVLDIRLRDGSGVDFIPEVRRLQPRAKIVLFTGDAAAADGSGADACLVKGIDPAEMLRQFQSLLSRNFPMT